jgi:tetratricopeptide (TPR) repeat protein
MIRRLLLAALFLQIQIAAAQSPPNVNALLQSGVDAENRNDLDEAIADFRKAADLDPSSADALLNLGDACIKKHDYAAAIPPLKRAAELSPDSVPVHQLLGNALLAEGYAAEAIPHLEIAHDSGALGIAQLETDQPAQAVANLREALSKKPDDPDLLFYLSRAGTALSSQSVDKLLSSFSQTARGHQVLAQDYYALKMFAEAIREYEQAIALRPDLPSLHIELGQIYAARSQWAQAEEQFRAETKLRPGNAEAAYRLGDALLQQGKMKEAAAELRRSDLLRSDMPETLYALGRASTVNNPDAAERALDRVVAIEKQTPLAAQAYLLLAGIHRRQGKSSLAAQEMQQYRRIQTLVPSGAYQK